MKKVVFYITPFCILLACEENYIAEAEVVLKDEAGNEQNAQESGNGEYWFDFQAKPGQKYKLSFKVEDDEYESDYEVMPPYPEFNNFQVLTESFEEYTFSCKRNYTLCVTD